jgi:hypothetical protein
MWDTEDLPSVAEVPPADQLWIIALAAEEAGGPPEHVLALRQLAEQLEELGWWLASPAGTRGTVEESVGEPVEEPVEESLEKSQEAP